MVRKYTLDILREEAKARGGKLISKDYQEKLKWECGRGHRFKLPATSVTYKNIWCPKCSTKWKSEEICRNLFELIFGYEFNKYYITDCDYHYLELDGYCPELSLAFEHQGRQHYEPVKIFNKTDSYENIKKRDFAKREVCKKLDICLVEIPQLYKLTPINNLLQVIKNQLGSNITWPSFNKKHVIKQAQILACNGNLICERYLKRAHETARNNNGKCLSDIFILASEKMKWECDRGHQWLAAYSNVVCVNQWCPNCGNRKHWLSKDRFKNLYFDQKLSLSKMEIETGIPVKGLCDIAKSHNLTLRDCKVRFTKKQLYDLYIKDRLSAAEIGKMYDLADVSVRRKLIKHNIPVRDNCEASLKHLICKDKLYQEYVVNGKNSEEVGKLFGCSCGTILYNLRKYNIEINDPSDYNKINIPKHELENLYITQNKTLPQIAEIYNCCSRTVYDYYNKYGLSKRSKYKRLTKKDVGDIITLHKQGMTTKDIAAKYNVSYTAIWNHIKKHEKMAKEKFVEKP